MNELARLKRLLGTLGKRKHKEIVSVAEGEVTAYDTWVMPRKVLQRAYREQYQKVTANGTTDEGLREFVDDLDNFRRSSVRGHLVKLRNRSVYIFTDVGVSVVVGLLLDRGNVV